MFFEVRCLGCPGEEYVYCVQDVDVLYKVDELVSEYANGHTRLLNCIVYGVQRHFHMQGFSQVYPALHCLQYLFFLVYFLFLDNKTLENSVLRLK